MSLGNDGKGGTANFVITYGQLRQAGISKKGDRFTGIDGGQYELTEDIDRKTKGYGAGQSLKN